MVKCPKQEFLQLNYIYFNRFVHIQFKRFVHNNKKIKDCITMIYTPSMIIASSITHDDIDISISYVDKSSKSMADETKYCVSITYVTDINDHV